MKLTNKQWWKAALVRALKTFVQALIAGGVAGIFTETWYVAVVTAILAGVLSVLNSLCVKLPEVEPTAKSDVTPEIEDEEIIDTAKEDDKLFGGGVDE